MISILLRSVLNLSRSACTCDGQLQLRWASGARGPAAGETFEETKSDEAPVRVRVLPKHVAVGSLSDAKGGDFDDPDFDF